MMFVNKTMQNYQIDEKKSAGWLKDILALLLLFSVIYLGFSWMRPLASPDEGRYSEIPMEMVRSGDYITPTLNDMPYFYKHLLSNVVKLIKERSKIDNKTCACLNTSVANLQP